MSSYNILFYLYLSLVLLLLLLFAFFVSVQLKIVLLYVFNFSQASNVFNQTMNFSDVSYECLFNFHLHISDYFLCISLSEFYLKSSDVLFDKIMIYVSLGLIYSQLSCWHIAEYYYLQSLSLSPRNKQINVALAILYSKLGYTEKSQYFYDAISLLDRTLD
uniref:Uncharacterized protein n=1 Tax=Leptosiphonia brodiei TaxID=2608611 RepID=A0A1Z1MA56_9FLOR|nr:hypothetical protein [Leptosiphonia brodiei]ARW62803.1 hypothetical protein [Leptosiphonia brodiei]